MSEVPLWKSVVEFWRTAGYEAWFSKSDDFDRQIRERFGELHAAAANGELDNWRKEPESALALIILLDQFSRNLYRDDARAFAQDEKACEIADAAIESGFPEKVDPELRSFFYMPFMHSEKIADQRRSISLQHALGGRDSLKYAIIHHDIIHRFGRFPHRNKVFGRYTTPAEQAFLKSGGFSG